MGNKILESNNYGMFEMMSFNRDVNKVKNLEASMKEHGWIDAYPLHVIQNGSGKFKIKAGHHRFFVAQSLRIPVKYVACKDKATIHELENATNQWKLHDYLDSYCRLGKPEYLQVKGYCNETGIGLALVMAMMGGHSAGTGNLNADFKDGKYKINTKCGHASLVKEIVLCLKEHKVKLYNAQMLVCAISKALWVKEFDISRFKTKIKSFSSLIEKKASLDQYLDMLEDIYNRSSHAKIPLKFLAYEEAKRRNATCFTFSKTK